MKIRLRDEIKEADKWSLENIYKNTEDFEKDFTEVKNNVNNMLDYKGKLSDGKQLLGCLKLFEKLNRKLEKLQTYSAHKFDENTTNQQINALNGKLSNYYSVFDSIISYMDPEIMNIPDDKFEENMKNVPELEGYRHFLESIRRKKEHSLDENGEKILASLNNCLESSENVFSLLTNADMKFPNVIDENGNESELSNGTYYQYMISKNREVRHAAYMAMNKTYKSYENTFAELLSTFTNSYVTKSKIRKYNSALEYALDQNNIPVSVYTEALKVFNENVKVLHRYNTLKKKYLGLEDIHSYDMSAPIVNVPNVKIEFDDAVKTITKALQPLGDEYVGLFKKGIEQRWIDKYPCKGKTSGAYSGGCYDSYPYVLLNYNDTLDDMSTLAHEMGHSIHSYYSCHNQTYINWNYPIFLAEIASTTNEILLSEYLIANEKDKDRKKYLLNQRLEQIEGTVFIQLKFAEFELYIHQCLEEGNTLTSDDLCEYWYDINKKCAGHDVVVDHEGDISWARVPHFYYNYYVYQYATGYAAANMFASKILNKEEGFPEKYINFLKSGCSDYPIETLKKCGIDMTSRFPLENVVDTFNRLLDELESL